MENKIHIQRDRMRAMNSFRQRECTFFFKWRSRWATLLISRVDDKISRKIKLNIQLMSA